MQKRKLIGYSALTVLLAACGSSAPVSSSAPTTTDSTTGVSSSSAASQPPGCAQIEAKYPQFKGKTLVDALTPFTPGYEASSPTHPGTYVGFDIDLLKNIASCLGFSVTYKSTAFPALIPTLQSGQANIVISDIYATPLRAKAVNFVTYEKVDIGVLTAKGNPKHITGFNTSLCGMSAAENTGFVEVSLVEAQDAACRAAGKPIPSVQLYNNNADSIQAVLEGRANVYMDDVNVVDQAASAHPAQLTKAATVLLPFSVGIAIPKSATTELNAVFASVKQIQKDGIESKLLAKWHLNQGSQEAPRIVS